MSEDGKLLPSFDLKTAWEETMRALQEHDLTKHFGWADRNSIAGLICLKVGWPTPCADRPKVAEVERLHKAAFDGFADFLRACMDRPQAQQEHDRLCAEWDKREGAFQAALRALGDAEWDAAIEAAAEKAKRAMCEYLAEDIRALRRTAAPDHTALLREAAEDAVEQVAIALWKDQCIGDDFGWANQSATTHIKYCRHARVAIAALLARLEKEAGK